MGIFSSTKDRIVEQAALSYLNARLLAPYGKATHLRINSADKTIDLEVELHGETDPVKIKITDYQITQEENRYFGTIKEIETSREWLTRLAQNQLLKNRFELPESAGRLLIQAL